MNRPPWGVQRGFTPLPRDWGCPPTYNSPKIGGHRGLIKAFVSALRSMSLDRESLEASRRFNKGCGQLTRA